MRAVGIMFLIITHLSILLFPNIDISNAYTQLRFRPNYNFNILFKESIRNVFIDGDVYVVTRNYQPDWKQFYFLALHKIDLLNNEIEGTYCFQTFDEVLFDIIFNGDNLLCVAQYGIYKISNGALILNDFFKIDINDLLGYDENKIYLLSKESIVIVNRQTLEIIEKIEFKFNIINRFVFENNILYFVSDNILRKYDVLEKKSTDLFKIDKQIKDYHIDMCKRENNIFFTIESSVYNFDVVNSVLIWEKLIPNTFDLEGFDVSDVIILSKWGKNGSEIFCLNKSDGSITWSYSNNEMLKSSAYLKYIDNLQVCFESYNTLFILDKKTGKILTKYRFNNHFRSVNKYADSYLISFMTDKNSYLQKFVNPCSSLTFKINSKKVNTDCGIYEIDQTPLLINNIAYISAKYLVEPLGGQLTYDQETKKIKINLMKPGAESNFNLSPENYIYRENTIELVNNSNMAIVNGRSKLIDPKNPKITPVLVNGRTMVPLRFLAESLECKTLFIAANKEIEVTYKP